VPQLNGEQSIPVTWPELVADSQPVAHHSLEAVKDIHELMASAEPKRPVSGYFQALAETFAKAAILLGSEKALRSFSSFDEFLQRAVDEFIPEIRKGHSFSAIGLLNYLNVCVCCGIAVSARFTEAEAGWLAQIAKHKRDLTESELRHLAFAALAGGALDLVPTFIGGGTLPQRFTPGETFQFNTQGFVRYIAVAMLSSAKAEDIEPAWRDFQECFPRKLASETLDWVDLMWAARTMMEHFEHQPVTVVADNLHKLVTSLAE
jgi:hypothetical protein